MDEMIVLSGEFLIGRGTPELTLVESRDSRARSLKQESPDFSRGECHIFGFLLLL